MGPPLLVALLCASSCSDAARRPDAGGPAVEAFRLADEPELQVGVVGGDPAQELFDVRAAERLSDGRIVIVNRGTSELRYYGADGTHLGTSGRRGEGPGEFEDVRFGRSIVGDSMVTYDYRLRRVSVFDPAGEFARSFEVDISEGQVRMFGGVGQASPAELVVRGDGTVFIVPAPPIWLARQNPDVPDGPHPSQVQLYELGGEGAVVDSAGPFVGMEFFIRNGRGNGLLGGRRLYAAAGPDRVIVGDGLTFDFTMLGPGGAPEAIRVDWPRRPYPQAQRDAEIDRVVEIFADPDAMRELYGAMPKADSLPAYSALLADETGTLWIGLYRGVVQGEYPDPNQWLAVGPKGDVIGTLETPEGLEVQQIERGYVTGIVTDEFDVERVLVYRILDDL